MSAAKKTEPALGPAGLQAQIAYEVSRARARSKLSQAEIARRAGVTQAAISRLESGGRMPRLETLLAIAEATGCRLDIMLVRRRRAQ